MINIEFLPHFHELLTFWNQHNNDPTKKIITYIHQTTLRTSNALKMDVDVKIFWENKEKSLTFISLGSLKEFLTISELKESKSLLQRNPDLYILGNLNFDLESPSDFGFIVPEITLKRDRNNNSNRLYINIDLDKIRTYQDLINYYHKIASYFEKKTSTKNTHLGDVRLSPDYKSWENLVNNSLEDILNEKREKIVLHRRFIFSIEKNFSSIEYFSKSKALQKSRRTYSYLFKKGEQTFFSFSPETLFTINNKQIKVDILAGTTKRGQTKKEDFHFAKELTNDPKEQMEHSIVKNDILTKLEPFVDKLHLTKDFQILKLNNIQHIHGIIGGEIKTKQSQINLLKSLHPTPAVGGYPNKQIIEYLREHEGISRGPYAAPFGVLNLDFNDLGVGIRCAQKIEDEIIFYTGCGIVKNSSPDKEWNETFLKLKSFMLNKNNEKQIEQTTELY